MFMLMGVGEQAGSGFARIQEGWKEQKWRAPRLVEQSGPDRIRLDMPMICLIPQEALDTLRKNIGAHFEQLAPEAIVALATAMIEGDVTNTRMQDLINDHPSDITKLLRGLVGKGLLETDNQRRWTRYRLPASIGPHLDLFSSANVNLQASLQGHSSALAAHSSDLPPRTEESPSKAEELKAIAAKIASKGKASRPEMEAAIIVLCQDKYLSVSELADLLNRANQNLRNAYLTPMVRAGKLRFRHPDQPNRTDQAYTTASAWAPTDDPLSPPG
jgi:ATP-dependent DNA helicase RecG